MDVNVESGAKRFFPFKRLLAAGSDPLRRERGQAAVRVALALSAMFAVFAIHGTAEVASGISGWFAVVTGYTSFAILLALWVWRSTAAYAWRRYLASAADAAIISYAMFSAGDVGFPMFVLYLWASLSNGFRFGVRALIVSTCLN